MILLLSGPSHVGKTLLASKIAKETGYNLLSLDLLKMGMIRSGMMDLSPLSDDNRITEAMWPLVSSMIQTAIENHQHIIVEGIYIPFDWKGSFDERDLPLINYVGLVMSEDYIRNNIDKINTFGSTIEKRMEESRLDAETTVREHRDFKSMMDRFELPHIMINMFYNPDAYVEAVLKILTKSTDSVEAKDELMKLLL